MPINLPLNTNDKNYLTDSKEDLQGQNSALGDAQSGNQIDLAKLYFLDIPYKKQTDPTHFDIYCFEEELRRLNGQYVIRPNEESGLQISSSINGDRLKLNNGRCLLSNNLDPIRDTFLQAYGTGNFPIIPSRGWSKSTVAGTDFDIWTRDRHGSSTSEINTQTTFTITTANERLKVSVDGLAAEIALSSLFTLPPTGLVLDATALASAIQVLFQRYGDPEFSITTAEELANPTYSINGTQDFTLNSFPVIAETAIITKNDVVLEAAKYTLTLNTGEIHLVDPIVVYHDILINSAVGGETEFLIPNTPIVNLTLKKNNVAITEFDLDESTGVLTLNSPLVEGDKLEAIHGDLITIEYAFSIFIDARFLTFSMAFNSALNTFTAISGSVGPTSTIDIISASVNDLKEDIGFTDSGQYHIAGRYANNLLKVNIDGTEKEIKINDFRKCFSDPTRGSNNDDIGVYWSGLNTTLGYIGTKKMGPLFCSGVMNGKEVARSIQSALREIGSGGFKDCICSYFSYDHTFIIYSGSFGTASSVNVIAHSDPLRDAKSFLGFDPPMEEIGHEAYYDTLDSFNTKLNSITGISSQLFGPASRACHSILYNRDDGCNIYSSFQLYQAMTTSVYDDASRGKPPLYPNGKLKVDETNDKINLFEIDNVELTITIDHGEYSEGELAEIMQENISFQTGQDPYDEEDPRYIVTYSQTKKKFKIKKSSGTFKLLWNSGKDNWRSIGFFLGYNITTDTLGAKSHKSAYATSFMNPNYFNIVFPAQFYSPTESPKLPLTSNKTIDEYSALITEGSYIISEYDSDILNLMKNATVFDNEVRIRSWETQQLYQYLKMTQEYNALMIQKGAYGNHISEADSEITDKTTAINNLLPNLYDLATDLAEHDKLLNLKRETKIFTAGGDFSEGGSQSLSISVVGATSGNRLYNQPAPLVHYVSSNKHIPGSWTPLGFYSSSANYNPQGTPAFRLQCGITGTQGYTFSSSSGTGTFNIPNGADTQAGVLSTNTQYYDLEPGYDIKIRVDGKAEQIATFSATNGSAETAFAITEQFIVGAGLNDKIDFDEAGPPLVATISPGAYNISDLITEIQNQLNTAGANVYTVTYVANKFTISTTVDFFLNFDTGPNFNESIHKLLGYDDVDLSFQSSYTADFDRIFYVQGGVNDEITLIKINSTPNTNPIMIAEGNYTGSTLCSEIFGKIQADPSFGINPLDVNYIANKFLLTSSLRGTNSKIELISGSFLPTILSFSIPTVVDGNGNVGNIDQVSAQEVCNVLVALITGIYAVPYTNKVLIATISVNGDVSSIEFTGGTASPVIGLSGTYYGINGRMYLKVDIDGVDTKDPIVLNSSPTPIPGVLVAADIQNKLNLVGTGGYLGSLCTFNETTTYGTFADKLRIISGTYGTSSSAFVSDKTIKIDNTNHHIDFEETIGVQKTITITTDFFTPTALAAEIQSKMNAAGSSNYTVSYSANKITFSSDLSGGAGIFRLKWYSGTNNASNCANILGFYKIDKLGSNSYISDGTVKDRDLSSILLFGAQVPEPGHLIDSCLATLSGSSLIAQIYWLDNGGGNRTDLNIPFFPNMTIGDLVTTVNSTSGHYTASYSAAEAIFLLSRKAQKYRIDDGDTIIISANNLPDQTFTFEATKAYSISGTNAKTRIVGGVNDQLKISFGVAFMPFEVIAVSFNGQTDFYVNKKPVVSGSYVVFKNGFPQTTSGENYITGKFEIDPCLTTDVIFVIYSYYVTFTIALGTQNTADDIAAAIQRKVREFNNSDAEFQAASLLFTCTYVPTIKQYVCYSGIGGKNSILKIYSAASDDAAEDLKLGTNNGGTEVAGGGDVNNNEFVETSELIAKISGSGFIASGVSYLKIKSTALDDTARIEISGTALEKLGFDNNDIVVPASDIGNSKVTTLLGFSNWEIETPEYHDVMKGYDNENIQIDFYSIDNERIISRQPIITNRLPNFLVRPGQILSRVTNVLNSMVSSLYLNRRNTVSVRLNKKSGSLCKIGDKQNQSESNDTLVAENNTTISQIDNMVGP